LTLNNNRNEKSLTVIITVKPFIYAVFIVIFAYLSETKKRHNNYASFSKLYQLVYHADAFQSSSFLPLSASLHPLN